MKFEKMTLEIHNKIKKDHKCGLTTVSVVIPIGDRRMAAVNIGDSRVCVLTKDLQLNHITTDDGPFKVEIPEGPYGKTLWEAFQSNFDEASVEVNEREINRIQKKVADMESSEYKKFKDNEQFKEKFEKIKKNKRKIEMIREYLEIRFAIINKNRISQLLGKDYVKPNITIFSVNPGERVIIASGGVHGNLKDREIVDCVSEFKTAEEAALDLIKRARERSLDETRPRHEPGDATAVIIDIIKENQNPI